MPKRTLKQEERRLLNSGQADISKDERFTAEIARNRELQSELATLRKNYRIELKTPKEQVIWVSSQPKKTLLNFFNHIEAIKLKYHIDKSMNEQFWVAIWNIPNNGYKVKAVLGSMPKIHWTKELGLHLIITPETDIENELVLRFIVDWQKTIINGNDKPPQPQKIKGSRQKNWIPVWEWNVSHPQITRKELSVMLNISYTHVKSKLQAIDKQMGNSILFSFQK